MNDFNIKKFLTENKMTRNSQSLNEEASNEVEVVDMDNRDTSTTELTLSNDIKVEVDVIDLFLNMVENLGNDELESEAEALIAKIKNI
ncbi:hypothetical protein OAA15_00285 [bacterium]|nr:hypothetical protein [bacterium]